MAEGKKAPEKDKDGAPEDEEAPAASDYDIKAVEAKWQERWEKEKTFWFDWNSEKPVYSIDNPPRYANAALHLGHATSYTQIDFCARYKRQRGHNVFFPLCADVNGMPIEVSTEKKYGVNRKNTSRKKLIEMCSAFANENITEMTRQFKLLGHSMDPSLFYQTNAPQYRRITQLTFLEVFKRGLAYKKEHPVTWCPSCGTALASADVEYQERKTKLNYIKFGKEDGSTETIATTRPELLCACQLVAVNPDDARHRDLLGKALFTPLYKKKVQVQADDKVATDFGTGIVMICTIGDKDDLEWIFRYKLPLEKGIDPEGKMTALAGKYHGMTIREAREAAIEDLKKEGLLVKQEDISQNVGTCWRCHTPVEFLQVPQWFLKVLDYRDRIIQMSNSIRWFPEFMKVRLENWANSLAWDWCISRQRYFATAIPVWECEKCGHAVVATAEQCYVDPTESPPPVDKCPKCGGTLKGCEDVFDTWMDSSITTLYNTFWGRDELKFKKLFPMSLRPQSHDIIRTWAFYTITRHIQLLDSRPWDAITINGFIMAPDGTPMHTSRGNVIDPLPMLDKYGADAFRFFAAACTLGMDHAFQSKEVVHGSKLVMKFWNIQKFVNIYTKELSGRPGRPPVLTGSDAWVLSTFAGAVKRVTALLDEYQFDKAMRELEGFMWHEFADHYIEMVKHRRDGGAVYSLYTVGLGLAKMLAVFMPHVTEEVYERNYMVLDGAKSIHTSTWPELMPQDEVAEKKGNLARDVIARLRAWKGKSGLRIGQPIGTVYIFGKGSEALDEFIGDIKGTLKAANILLSRPPDFREEAVKVVAVKQKVGPVFKAKGGMVTQALEQLPPKETEAAIARGPIEISLPDGSKATILPEMVRIERASLVGSMKVEAVQMDDMTLLVELPEKK